VSYLLVRSLRWVALCLGTAILAVVTVRPAAGAARAAAAAPTYKILAFSAEVQKQLTVVQVSLLEKLNRRDREHLARLTEVIAPEYWTLDELAYSPLPATWTWAEAHPKVLIVDQPTQLWGAYELGKLVRWGPTSTGRQETPTPAGSYNLTWRSKSRRSTDNREWILKWYFNFINARGISFHEFELPGRPASHACVRLLERDARWVYDWGVQWVLNPDKRHVDKTGTPVIVVGAYDFAKPPPWIRLDWWQTQVGLPANPQP
jgi:lipoprotein-anchoring transpeptidase ErfK/SrfK